MRDVIYIIASLNGMAYFPFFGAVILIPIGSKCGLPVSIAGAGQN